MIRYFCDGSYKKEMKIVACGIVRVSEEETKEFFKCTKKQIWFGRHEEFSLYQTLLMIEKEKEKNVTIYNDSLTIVRSIRHVRKKENTVSKRQKRRIQPISIKLAELKKKGYTIHLKHQKENQSPYMLMAHECSRAYLKTNEEETKQKKKKAKFIPVKVTVTKEDRKFRDKEETEKLLVGKTVVKRMNTDILENSHTLSFRRKTNEKWVAFNERNEPICVRRNIAGVAYHVLGEVFKERKTIQVNGNYKRLFDEYRNGRTIRNREMVNQIIEWIEKQKIIFVENQ